MKEHACTMCIVVYNRNRRSREPPPPVKLPNTHDQALRFCLGFGFKPLLTSIWVFLILLKNFNFKRPMIAPGYARSQFGCKFGVAKNHRGVCKEGRLAHGWLAFWPVQEKQNPGISSCASARACWRAGAATDKPTLAYSAPPLRSWRNKEPHE